MVMLSTGRSARELNPLEFEQTPEQAMILASVDRLMDRHLPPAEVRRRDAACEPPVHLLPRMAEAGFLSLPVATHAGGAGGDWQTMSLVQERLGYHAFMAAALFNRVTCFGLMTLSEAGSDAQKAHWLPALMAGEGAFALALTEPMAGSDAGALTTRAQRVDGGWRLSGRKSWISGAAEALRMVVAARTDPDTRGARGVGLFLVPPDAPGVSMTRLEKLGNRCSLSYDVGLDEVTIGDDALIGPAGEGFAVLRRTLFYARSGLAASVVGTAQAAVDAAAAHARERVQFDRRIGAFQVIAHRLARMQTEVDLARLIARALARGIDAGVDCNRLAAQAKYVTTETLKRVTEDGMQIMASAGYAEGSDMQRYWRDARLYTFGEGSSEIQLDLIARDMGLGGALETRR